VTRFAGPSIGSNDWGLSQKNKTKKVNFFLKKYCGCGLTSQVVMTESLKSKTKTTIDFHLYPNGTK